LISCSHCGAETPAGHPYCIACGAALLRVCPVCGEEVAPNARFCHHCGSALGGPSTAATTEDVIELTERRLVTVLFADLVGFTGRSEQQDPEETAAFLASFFARARDVIHRFGGLVEKYVGDAVMAVWGARTANEDDAERAVRAALELPDVVAKLAAEAGDPGINLRVGVLTGEAAVRSGGNESTGMIVGDLVNSAARIQQTAAPGTVVVGESTYRAASGAIAFAPAGTPQLRGRRTGIATWRALRVVAERGGRGRASALEPPFVGRRDELELLKDLLGGVNREGRARIVWVVGEVGIGKSRLVWELQKWTDGLAESIYWNQGRSLSYGSEGVAYQAISDMLRRRIGVTETDGDDVVASSLQTSLELFVADGAERGRIGPWLAALLCCGPAPGGERTELDAAIRTYLAGMTAQAPAVLVFEDLQWADSGMLDFVEQLPDWLPDAPMLILALARPELLERRAAAASRRGAVMLRLAPLPNDDMAALVTGILGPLSPELSGAIVDRAAGIPLYAVELARALMGQGLVTQVDGVMTAHDDLASIAIPETLQSLIGSRIDRLAPADRALLQDAAVLGHNFTAAGLAALTGRNELEIGRRLASFVEQELVEPVRDPRSPRRGGYRFVQELVREVARNRMSREVRRARHVAAAEYVASLGGPDQAVIAADHYLYALAVTPEGTEAESLRRRASDVIAVAMDRAAELYAHEEVLSLGQRLVDLGLDLPVELEMSTEQRMAVAASALVRRVEAESHAGRMVELARRSGDVTSVRRAVGLAALVDLDSQRSDRAVGLLERELEGVEDLAATPELASLGGLLARAQLLLGRFPEALAAAERALVAAERFHLAPVVGDVLVTRASIIGVQGRTIEARLLLESLIEFAKRHDLTALALRAYINLGAVVPQSELAGDPTLEAIELGRRIGSLNMTLFAEANRIAVLTSRADWKAVADLIADPLWQSATGPLLVSWHAVTAIYEAARGNVAEAQASLAAALAEHVEPEDADAQTDPQHRFGIESAEAFVRLLGGEHDAAATWGRAALGSSLVVPWLDGVGRTLLLCGDGADIAALSAAIDAPRRTSEPRLAGFVDAALDAHAGTPGGLGAAEQLIAAVRGDGLGLDEVIWTIGLARLLAPDSADRRRLLAAARNRIGELGLYGLAPLAEDGTPSASV